MNIRLTFGVPAILVAVLGMFGFLATTEVFAVQERIILSAPTPTLLPNHPPAEENVSLPNSEPQAQTISSIESQSPSCVSLVPGSGICTINWNYISVSASPSYIISMTLSIDGRLRAYASGFFQTSMGLPGDFFNPGFRVVCGFPNPATPGMGNVYHYEIRSRSSDNTTSANYGQVKCPADIVKVSLPLILKP